MSKGWTMVKLGAVLRRVDRFEARDEFNGISLCWNL